MRLQQQTAHLAGKRAGIEERQRLNSSRPNGVSGITARPQTVPYIKTLRKTGGER